jgi:hypothetical protein
MNTPNAAPVPAVGTVVDPAVQAQTVDPAVTPQMVSVEELAKIKADFDSQLSNIKAAQSGVDKLNTELRKQNEELKTKGMSDKERSEYEKKLFENEKANFEREKAQLTIEAIKSDFMLKNQIDPEWRQFIHGENEDGLKAEVEKIKALILKATAPLQLELDKFNAAAGKPGGGASNVPKDAKAKMLEAEAKFREAQAKGDYAAQQAAADEAFYWKEQSVKIKT